MQLSESSQTVFVSYTSQDAEAARRNCEALRAGISRRKVYLSGAFAGQNVGIPEIAENISLLD